jgi:hypothetical protein
MTLVLFDDQSKANAQGKEYESTELKSVRNKLDTLTTGHRILPYIGLSN